MEAFDQLDSILWIGKKLMEYGADSANVEEAMYAYANGIGVEQMDALVLPRSVLVTIYLGDEYKTKMKHVGDLVPNLGKASRIYKYAKNPDGKNFDEFKTEIDGTRTPYTKTAQFAVSLACAAFGVILGTDFVGGIAIFVASFVAFFIKSKLIHIEVSLIFVNIICAFVATLLSYQLATRFGSVGVAEAQAASTFFLIPGVQLINTFRDMLKGHYLNGAARGLRAMFLAFGIVFGTTLALLAQKGFIWNF